MHISMFPHDSICLLVLMPLYATCTKSFYYTLTIQYYYTKTHTSFLFPFSGTEYKTITSSEAERFASSRMALIRTWPQCLEYTLLFPLDDIHWGNDKQVEKGEKRVSQHTASEHLARSIPKRMHPRRDELYMASFLQKSKSDALVFNLSKYSHRQLMPHSTSLLDLVVADSRRLDSWCVSESKAPASELFETFQKYRGLSPVLLETNTVKEIHVGVESSARVSRILDWAREMHQRDQSECPTGLISVDVESIQILWADYEKIVTAIKDPNSGPIIIKDLNGVRLEKKQAMHHLARIMIGNGITWTLMITVVTEPAGDGMLKMNPPMFQQEVVQYLRDLPRVTGVGIEGDVRDIEQHIRGTTDPSFRLQGWVDLGSLAVLAGWNFRFFNMQALSVQALGAIMNKSVSCGDGKWGFRWSSIPDPLKIYCIGDVKFGFQVSVLLLTILLRDLFPDPDIVLSFTRIDGHQFLKWFALWVGDAIQDLRVDPVALGEAKSRLATVFSLRYVRSDGNVASTPPSRVTIFAKLLGPWPTLPFGGPRFLHQVRRHFLLQCDIFTDSKLSQWKEVMPYEIDLPMKCSVTYALPGLSALDYTIPVASSSCGLTLHPAIAHLTLQGTDVSSEAVRVLAEEHQRVRREVVYEWIRLNLAQTQRFIDTMAGDPYYLLHKGSYLLEPKMIYRRCTGVSGPDHKVLSHDLAAGARRHAFREHQELERLKRELPQREKRLEFFLFWGYGDRDTKFSPHSWRGNIPKVTPRSAPTRLPSFLQDYEAGQAYREIEHRSVEPVAPVALAREVDEPEIGEGPPPPKKKRKGKKKGAGVAQETNNVGTGEFEWFGEDAEMPLILNTSITDSELMPEC